MGCDTVKIENKRCDLVIAHVSFSFLCRYIFMAEPDHIVVKPIPNLAKFGSAAAFPFFYIEPKKYEPVLRNFYPENKGPITNIDPVGNSPVIIDKVFFILSYFLPCSHFK